MADDDAVERRLRELERSHDLTRWYTGRVDRDLAEIAVTQQEHTAKLKEHDTRFDAIDAKLQAHDGRFDSLDAQMRSLTQMIGQVLERLPAPDENGK